MCDHKISSFAYSEALHNVAPLEILKKSLISRTTRQNSQDFFLSNTQLDSFIAFPFWLLILNVCFRRCFRRIDQVCTFIF